MSGGIGDEFEDCVALLAVAPVYAGEVGGVPLEGGSRVGIGGIEAAGEVEF